MEVAVTCYVDIGGHTEYVIEASFDGRKQKSQHRFSDFVDLHGVIQPHLASRLPVSFPVAKSVFGGEAVKRERVGALNSYLLDAAAASGSHPPEALLAFLRLDGGAGGAGSSSARPAPRAEASAPPSSTTTFAPFSDFQIVQPDDINEGLRDAIKANDSPTCMKLIEANADPNYKDRQGNTPLHMACLFQRTDVACALLTAGSDPTIKNSAGELPSRMAPVSLKMKIQKFQTTGKFK